MTRRRHGTDGPPPGYPAARARAQAAANELGMDHGLERNAFGWSVFLLPMRRYRQGHETRCEVVMPESIERTQPGHGCRS